MFLLNFMYYFNKSFKNNKKPMTISISNLIVQEATPGIAIGTLSTDATSTGTFSLSRF